MRLLKFRIQNYKSIIDSGYCEPAADITILIGKNESGKTSTLEALRDFDRQVQDFAPEVYPLDGTLDEPLVEMHFQVSRDELEKIQQESGIELDEETLNRVLGEGWTLTKNGRGEYAFSEDYLQAISASQAAGQESDQPDFLMPLRSAKDKLFELLQGHPVPNIQLVNDPKEINKASKEIVRNVKQILTNIGDENLQQRIVESLRGFIKEVESLTGLPRAKSPLFIDHVVHHLPRFVFFNEFTDVLPFEIPVVDVKKNRAVCDFAKIARLNLDKVIDTTDLQKRINLLNRYSAAVSGDFLNYWEQNKIEIIVKPEGDKLIFGLRESETTNFFKMSQRSKGFQWFLSFYLRLQAEAGPNKIILIDEPGTNLHAKAQKEIIRVLVDKISPTTQVIFSTHSPYLIDPERLDRVRLVVKDAVIGTELKNHNDPQADEETLRPLATARGSEAMQPSVMAPSGKSVVMQNSAMFYYIQALQLLMPDSRLDGIKFVPGADADQIGRLVSLLLGQGNEFIILLEANNEGRQVAEALRDKFALDDNQLVFISQAADYSVEDLFSQEDFNNFILPAEKNMDPVLSNARFMRQHQVNRVVAAKAFFDQVRQDKESVKLGDEAIRTYLELVHHLLVGLHEIEPVEEKPTEPEPEATEPQEGRIEEQQEEQQKPVDQDQPAKRRTFFGLRI